METPVFNDEELKKKSLSVSIREGCANAISDGFGHRYIPAYAIALGASNAIIGLLATLPSLIGSFSQLFSYNLLKFTTRKKAIVTAITIQAIMWLPLLALGIILMLLHANGQVASVSTNLSFPLLLVFLYSALVLVSSLTSPLWSSWMRDLLGENIGEYFARRSRTMGFFSLVSMAIAGVVLDYSKQTNVFLGFTIIFFIAFIGRLISSILLRKQYDPKYGYDNRSYFSFFAFIRKAKETNYGHFTIYIGLMLFVVAIASPFFAVYQLKNLGLSYIWYTGLLVTALISTIVFLPLWGKFTDKFGNLAALNITGYIIPLIPLAYLLVPIFLNISFLTAIIFLFLVEIISGFSWAGFDLATGNFAYKEVSREKMPLCISYSNLIYAIGMFFGAMLGGFLSTWIEVSSSNFNILGIIYPSILILFLISAILRFSVSAIMLPKIHEIVKKEKFEFSKFQKELNSLNLWHYIYHHKVNGHVTKTKT